MSVPQPPRSRLQIAVCTTKPRPPCTAAIDGNVPAEQMGGTGGKSADTRNCLFRLIATPKSTAE